MILLKFLMLILTIFLIIANNYKKDNKDHKYSIDFILFLYIVIIIFG